jgi:RNA polymerase sigma-70 factor (ECF subfamily)
LTKDRDQAQDLVQETYLRAFQSFDKFQPGTNCKAWLLSILRNLFINQYNHKRREPDTVNWEAIEQTYEAMVQNGHEDPQSPFFSQLMDREIQQALKELPEEFRTAIVLVDIEELSYEEAARVMNCPVGTIRSRLSRGRRMLQVALRDYAIERGVIRG